MIGTYTSPKSSDCPPANQQYSIKKGIGFGAFGGFIAIVAFTGIMLLTPVIQGLPTGTFIDALGTFLAISSGLVSSGIAGFGIILLQGIIVGIIFGAVTSKIKVLRPSDKKRGISFGLATGIIAFGILYLPTIFSIIPITLVNYHPADITTMGIQTSSNKNNNLSANFLSSASNIIRLPITLAFGFLAYLVYGFVMGGIVTLAYSVYHFDLSRIEEYHHKGNQQQKNISTT